MSVEYNSKTQMFELLCEECGTVIDADVAEDADPDALCDSCDEEINAEVETPSDADPEL